MEIMADVDEKRFLITSIQTVVCLFSTVEVQAHRIVASYTPEPCDGHNPVNSSREHADRYDTRFQFAYHWFFLVAKRRIVSD